MPGPNMKKSSSTRPADAEFDLANSLVYNQNPCDARGPNGGTHDTERQEHLECTAAAQHEKVSAFKSLGLLDRFLAVWIFLAMLTGILLGNFVKNVGPALQRGKFVGVSIPIGESNPPTPEWLT